MPQGDAFATMSSTEALARLATSQGTGLTSAEAASRLAKYGINGIVEKEGSTLKKLLGYFTGSISYMIEAAAVISALLGRWSDFAIITGAPRSSTPSSASGKTTRRQTRWRR